MFRGGKRALHVPVPDCKALYHLLGSLLSAELVSDLSVELIFLGSFLSLELLDESIGACFCGELVSSYYQELRVQIYSDRRTATWFTTGVSFG